MNFACSKTYTISKSIFLSDEGILYVCLYVFMYVYYHQICCSISLPILTYELACSKEPFAHMANIC